MISSITNKISAEIAEAEEELVYLLEKYSWDDERLVDAFMRSETYKIPVEVAICFSRLTTLGSIVNQMNYLPAVREDWSTEHHVVNLFDQVLEWVINEKPRVTKEYLDMVATPTREQLFILILLSSLKGDFEHVQEDDTSSSFDNDPEAA